MKRLIRVLGLFLLIYNPPIIGFNVIHILAVFALFVIIRSSRAKQLLLDAYRRSHVFLVACLICSVSIIFNGTFSSFLNLFAIFLEIIPVCVVFFYFYGEESGPLLDDVILTGCLQSVIAIFALLFPPLQSMIVGRMITVGYSDAMQTMASWRMFGLSRELTFAMPVVQSLIACLCLYFSIVKDKIYLIPIPFLVFSSIINARTGIIVFGIGGLFVLLSTFRFKFSSVLTIMIVGLILWASTNLFSSFISNNEVTAAWLLSGVEDITAFVSGGELDENDSYFTYLSKPEKYRVPENLLQFLFGTGERSQGNANIQFPSDIGYINDIWLGGIIYMLLVVYFFSRTTYKIVFSDGLSRKVRRPRLLALGIVSVLLATNVKGQLFTWNEFLSFWFLLFIMFLNRNSKHLSFD